MTRKLILMFGFAAGVWAATTAPAAETFLTGLASGWSSEPDPPVEAIAADDDGFTYIIGSHHGFVGLPGFDNPPEGVGSSYVGQVNPDGSFGWGIELSEATAGPSAPAEAYAIEVVGDEVWVGGRWAEDTDAPWRGIIWRFDRETGAFRDDIRLLDAAARVTEITSSPDGEVLVGGDFFLREVSDDVMPDRDVIRFPLESGDFHELDGTYLEKDGTPHGYEEGIFIGRISSRVDAFTWVQFIAGSYFDGTSFDVPALKPILTALEVNDIGEVYVGAAWEVFNNYPHNPDNDRSVAAHTNLDSELWLRALREIAFIQKLDEDGGFLEYHQEFRYAASAPFHRSAISDLRWQDGWLYVSGHWQGRSWTGVDGDGNDIFVFADGSSEVGERRWDVWIARLSPDLSPDTRVHVHGVGDNQSFGLAGDPDNNLYLTGLHGAASTTFGDLPEPVSSSVPRYFITKLNPSLSFQWLQRAEDAMPDVPFPLFPAYHSQQRRLAFVGSFRANDEGALTSVSFGPVESRSSFAAEAGGFMTLMLEDGSFLEQVVLSVGSAYGGERVRPALGDTIVVRGQEVTVEVPARIFDGDGSPDLPLYLDRLDQNLETDEEIAAQAASDLRLTCVGFSVNGEIVSGSENRYRFVVTENTEVVFNWRIDHALRVNSVFPDDTAVPPEAQTAMGDPSPAAGRTWIQEGEDVTVSVDGAVVSPVQSDTGIRYAVDGYSGFGDAPSGTVISVSSRLQVPSFTMNRASAITLEWKRQFRLRVNSSPSETDHLPRVLDLSESPDARNSFESDGWVPEALLDGAAAGSEEFWFDQGAYLLVATRESSGTKTVQGWLRGEGDIPDADQSGAFDAMEDLRFGEDSDDPDLAYRTIRIPSFSSASLITWDYDHHIIHVDLAIGEYLDFTEIPPDAFGPVRPEDVRTDQRPVVLDVENTPPGTTNENVFRWDEVRKKAFPLRAFADEPAVFRLEWETVQGGDGKVITEIDSSFPQEPHYRHVAETPAVDLEPDAEDDFHFIENAFTTGDGRVSEGSGFVNESPGWTVLVFSRSDEANPASFPARGNLEREMLHVRTVRTWEWDDHPTASPDPVPAAIGSRLSSGADTAGLGTGYVVFENARYNADIYSRSQVEGPIYPVNRNLPYNPDKRLVVVWYETHAGEPQILWPYLPIHYEARYPDLDTPGTNRIVIASGLGSDGVDHDGEDQLRFDRARFTDVRIYNQPDRAAPGYNPNEEHALIAASQRYADGQPPPAAFALRNDLNLGDEDDPGYTSEPFVLVEYFDTELDEHGMVGYHVLIEDEETSPTIGDDDREFTYTFTPIPMDAGEPVFAPYPLNLVIGAVRCGGTFGRDGGYAFSDDPEAPFGHLEATADQRVYWEDHRGQPWAVSGGDEAHLTAYFFYPLQPDFWYEIDNSGNGRAEETGDCIPWLPAFGPEADGDVVLDDDPDEPAIRLRNVPRPIRYRAEWPDDLPILKAGETLTFPGGENRADDSGQPGLPGSIGWAAGQIVFDSANRNAVKENYTTDYMGRLINPLEERVVSLPRTGDLEAFLDPAGDHVRSVGEYLVFNDLPPSMQKRVRYHSLREELILRGFINDRTLGDPSLTESPPPLYAVEPNVLTAPERERLLDLVESVAWVEAVEELAALSHNPASLSPAAGDGYYVGLEPFIERDARGKPILDADDEPVTDASYGEHAMQLGPGLAVVTNPALLDPAAGLEAGFLTVAENNHPDMGAAPVTLHIIRIDPDIRYRGAIQTILPENAFEEKITLRHTGDFGGNVEQVVFEWYLREEDGQSSPPPHVAGQSWALFPDPSGREGGGYNEITLEGTGEVLLRDNLVFSRYRHANDPPFGEFGAPEPGPATWEWAGAANNDPPDYVAQLAMGWVKRVLDAINPYEARIRDFSESESPASYVSMIRQLGPRFEGAVALNPDKGVVEGVGLIELYQTVLNRATALSIDLSTPVSSSGVNAAILLAATRLHEFHMLLANEAYADAQDPTIGFGTTSGEYGTLATTMHAFQQQVPGLLDEELALLRGRSGTVGRPVYNRLMWNFTGGLGEAAYAMAYNITDVNLDGFVDAHDAMILYPQGHGDAWGHYLTAIRYHYDLLRHSHFFWEPRSELYNVLDTVIDVDYMDERRFAQAASARAKAGREIVNLTYRQRYVEDPAGQWQGYTDTDEDRAWGVTGWARRAGQGAYFDWAVANAILPSEDPVHDGGIQRIDRTTVTDIDAVAANLGEVQAELDRADRGLNPLGLDSDVVPFDIDPIRIDREVAGATHFEQIHERAVKALRNARTVFDHANRHENRIREIADTEEAFRHQVRQQDTDYRNRLIEVFGTPYAGTIGTGRAYPAGYRGPDLALWMYVGVNAVNNQTVPGAPDSNEDFTFRAAFQGFRQHIAEVDGDFQDVFTTYFLNDYADTSEIEDVEFLEAGIVELDLPATSGSYSFQAPADWGERDAPGDLQRILHEILLAEADLLLAIGDYGSLVGRIADTMDLIEARHDIGAVKIEIKEGERTEIESFARTARRLRLAAALASVSADYVKGAGDFVAEGVPKMVGTSNDVTFPVRLIAKSVGLIGSTALNTVAAGLEHGARRNDDWITLEGLDTEIKIMKEDLEYALREHLKELEQLFRNEASGRIEIFKRQEVLRDVADKFRAKLQEGIRLIDERRDFNIKVAGVTQRQRYRDMTFRIARNDALQKYRAAFDLAARYTYLAAKAYDYETNLDPNHAGSARRLLEEIVRERLIGEIQNGEPVVGQGGLAGILAVMGDNFDVLQGQLGFNNPQTETGRFSLRRELFRIHEGSESDAAWRAVLEDARVDDLWLIPEFRRYLRPPAPRSDGPLPGLVIPFSSEVVFGRNFFGRSLGGGDNAYDPTHFATKIRSVGVWFDNYDSWTLAATPRVYLVPVGYDVMTVPTAGDLRVRSWNVVDQRIPVPHAVGQSHLDNPEWLPVRDSLGGPLAEIRRHSSLRAYGDSGFFDPAEMTFDSRLIGRSVWNTKWLLIIPGGTFLEDGEAGLDAAIHGRLLPGTEDGERDGDGIRDIRLFFQTYSHSGN